MRRFSREARAIGLAYVVFAVLAAASLAPIQDETYYWAWSRVPAIAYVDHPPAVAWVLAASSAIFGDGLLALRVPALVAMALTALFVVLAADRLRGVGVAALTPAIFEKHEEKQEPEVPVDLAASGPASEARSSTSELGGSRSMNSPREARISNSELVVLLLAGAPMFLVGYLPATPDPFQGAVTALAAYLVVRALESGARAIWPGAAAFVLVASTLVKHSSAVIAVGALLGAVASSEGRAVLRRPSVWMGALLGAVLVAAWLAADASVAFQAERVLSRGSPRGLLALPILLGGVIVALGPGGALLLIARHRGPVARVLVAGSALLLLGCLVPVGLGGGELNWSMPAFVFMLPLAALLPAGRMLRAIRSLAAVSALILAAVLAHIVHPYLPLPAAKDTTLRGAGYETLAARALAEATAHHAAAIVTRRYQAASELRYHTRDTLPVVELGGTRKSQYDAWPKHPLCAGETVLIALNTPALPPELELERAPDPGAASIAVDRLARGEVVEHWYLTPARLARDAAGAQASCATRLATHGAAPP